MVEGGVKRLLAIALLAAVSLPTAAQEAAPQAGPVAAPAPPATVEETGQAPSRDLRPTDVNGSEAILGLLDKRMGVASEVRVKVGERFQWGRLNGILQRCSVSVPWQKPQTGAFVQVWETPPVLKGRPAPKPKQVFSGWLFHEDPSLNPFINPVYDVWLKSCTINRPEGPRSASSSRGTTTRGGVSN